MIKLRRLSTVIVGCLLIVLLASLALNYVLYKQGEEYYLQLNAMRLDPLGLNDYQGIVQSKSGLPLVVFFGDSRAASWLPPDLREFEFVNRGIGSQTSIQVLARFDYDVKPLNPNIIIVQAGINDLKTIPLFPDRKKTIVTNCKENVRQIVERSTKSGATVIVTTIFPVAQVPIWRKPFWSDDVAIAVDEVNVFIRSLAGSKVIVFDTYAVLASDKGITRPEYSQDLLHLTNLGYQRLNAELTPILLRLK